MFLFFSHSRSEYLNNLNHVLFIHITFPLEVFSQTSHFDNLFAIFWKCHPLKPRKKNHQTHRRWNGSSPRHVSYVYVMTPKMFLVSPRSVTLWIPIDIIIIHLIFFPLEFSVSQNTTISSWKFQIRSNLWNQHHVTHRPCHGSAPRHVPWPHAPFPHGLLDGPPSPGSFFEGDAVFPQWHALPRTRGRKLFNLITFSLLPEFSRNKFFNLLLCC